MNQPVIDLRYYRQQYAEVITDPEQLGSLLDVRFDSPDQFARTLPFSKRDTTVGVENELQAAVAGARDRVDLPLSIQASGYYKNVLTRFARGEMPRAAVAELERWLENNTDNLWENSWVRFPRRCLSAFADNVLETDLKADKNQPDSPLRTDLERFVFFQEQEPFLRIPVSYLLKLSLADMISRNASWPNLLRATGERLMRHFLNDNTSPETFSFYPVDLHQKGACGQGVAAETLKRYLLTHLLISHANCAFDLAAHGQQAEIYFAPHPPVRQKKLNDLISDAFYRELFMSPCLSGWPQGQVKHAYMELCHQVLSRSQLNAVAKLRDAGIITTNLIVLPNISNTSLANNGTHISLGSRRLAAALSCSGSGFTALEEKYTGDLVIKIMEHFLPLFVNTYSAAPYRLDFADFHPERVLGFLPHELEFAHLRMIWRRWKKKARLKICGQPITPFGLTWLDKGISRLFGLRGDLVPDFRLLDYLVALSSTEASPALNGALNNGQRLKDDLQAMGVFESGMALYQLYRLREFKVMGYSGFEGRGYSQFASLTADLGPAAALQNLLTALAYKYIFSGQVRHPHIPDTPFVESERRQIFFGTAIGLPTFFVQQQTPNRFLRKILTHIPHTRLSRRYAGYVRIHHQAYRKALVRIIQQDAADLIELLELRPMMQDLEQRLDNPDTHTALGRLLQGVQNTAGIRNPLKLPATEFNLATETYYRQTLRRQYLDEALTVLIDDWETLVRHRRVNDAEIQEALMAVLNNVAPPAFLKSCRKSLPTGDLTPEMRDTLLQLILLSVAVDGIPQHGRDSQSRMSA